MTNAEIAQVLREIAVFLDMEGVPFKPRAYEKAAYAVEAWDKPLREVHGEGGLKALEAIPTIGRGIAERIEELLTTGSSKDHDALRRKYPVDLAGLTAIEGVGPKMVKALYEDLGIRTVDDLEAAARAGRIRELPHFGEKTEKKILKGIGFVRQGAGRKPLGHVLEPAREIEARLRAVPGVRRVAIAGSIRRFKETIGDADFLVVARHPDRVMDFFTTMPDVRHVHAKGPTRSSVRLALGMDADLRVVPEESFGAALHYFTGSKDHNIALRRIAQEKGLKLNEYGVFRGECSIAGATEEEVYAALGLPFIAPELRENAGEIEAAGKGRLPRLLEAGDVLGDVQVHTTWTDGANTIEEMVDAARRLGRRYIAVTDHTRGLAMTGGCDEAKLLEQVQAIRRIDAKLRGFRLLSGAEVNITRDGTLDIDDEVLARLDVVGAAVHSHFTLPREEQTRRLVCAIENPHVDILFHPTARDLSKRPPMDVDIDAIIEAARRTGTVLEIDAYPDRLDLKDEHVRKAIAAGVKIAIDSDAHHVNHLPFVDTYGIPAARRGWAGKDDVVNARPVDEFLGCLKDRAGRPASGRTRRPPARKRSGD